jgi:Flp pilus assembly protein TadG
MTRTRDVGSAAVELVVALPVLVVLVVGTADLARVMYYAVELTNAARAGAQYAAFNSVQATQTSQIMAAAQNAAPNIGSITIELSSPPAVCRCVADNGSSFGASVSCATTCPTGQHLAETVTVSATRSFSPISALPGIPRTLFIRRSATFRIAL